MAQHVYGKGSTCVLLWHRLLVGPPPRWDDAIDQTKHCSSVSLNDWRGKKEITTRRMESHSFHVQHSLSCVDIHKRHQSTHQTKWTQHTMAFDAANEWRWHQTEEEEKKKKHEIRKLIRLHVINWFFSAGTENKPKEIRMRGRGTGLMAGRK